MDAHSLGGKGWIVKAPYVQNQRGFLLIYISSDISSEELKKLFQTIIQNPNRQFNKNGVMNADVFPYLIIQPRLDPAESKVVLLNGSPKFICSIQGKRGWFLSSCLMYASILVTTWNQLIKCFVLGILGKKTQEQIFTFVVKAWNKLKEATDEAFLCDGLTRVDVFCDYSGNLVVNEFESLDANFSSKDKNVAEVKMFLTTYYTNVLIKCLSELN